MNEFDVTLVSASGHQESRVMVASSEMDAARQILMAGNTPVHVRLRGRSWLDKLKQPIRSADRVRLPDLALFSEQLAEMLKAGVTVEQGLDLLARQSNRTAVSRLARRLLEKIRTGSALSQALADEKHIPRFFSGLVRGSERGGRLVEGLAYLGEYLLRQASTRSRIIAALTYPAVVVVTSVFALLFVLVVVIPEFAPLFAGAEKRLPAVTRIVVWLSELVTTRSYLVMFVFLSGLAMVWLASKRANSISGILPAIRKLPPADMVIRLDIAKSMRVMGALLASGIDASEAAVLANESATFKWLKSALWDVSRRIREGAALSEALRDTAVLPASIAPLVAVGERTGEIGAAMLRAANLLEGETNRRIDRLISLLNPIAIVLLGGLIAALIAGVMLGILSANEFALR